MTNKTKISIRNLFKSFGPKHVLKGLDLDVYEGESLVIIGGSGTGKSVLLKCILGIIQPDSGSIKIDGQEIIGLSISQREEFLSKMGMLFQSSALFDSLTVWENVIFGFYGSRRKKMHLEDAQKLALKTLASVGLGEDVASLYPAELSGGMQKRVGLARAIATQPEIIFFDEPTTGLDPIMASIIDQLISKCVANLGATALSITHDLNSARKIANRMAMILDGKIIWQGPVQDIDQSNNPYVDQFIHGKMDGPIKMSVKAW
ncbi:MAG: ATP-binding cassette domain-containing protein [Alphaproteobacteria bacterium]|nr:ATP-binding cassette domain-containing protein [Alphaproteobacteria bacterium]